MVVVQELEETPIMAVPPPEPAAAQKLASLAVFSELLVGFLFALGLGVSGMVRPSKVAAFLSVLGGEAPRAERLARRWAAGSPLGGWLAAGRLARRWVLGVSYCLAPSTACLAAVFVCLQSPSLALLGSEVAPVLAYPVPGLMPWSAVDTG